MSDKIKKRVVIALGYFDSVHLGHKKVIERAKEEAEKVNAQTVVFTFKGNLKAVLGKDGGKVVYTAKERENFIKALGADEIYFAPVDFNFLSIGRLAFLNMLNRIYDIVCYVSGADYRFGKFGKGSVEDIKRYAKEKGQSVITVDTLNFERGKISTTAIKGFLSDGKIEQANRLLGRPYSVTGTVFKDRCVGSSIGFPTVNIKIEKDKHRIKDGVYVGGVIVDGKNYKAIINYGARPTFNLDEKLIEAHIVDFSGDLYGQNITVNFYAYMREIKRFSNAEQLKSQLNEDLLKVKNYD